MGNSSAPRIRECQETVTVFTHDGKAVEGQRRIYRRRGSGLAQVVEYEGRHREDEETYRGTSHDGGMLWEARRILLDLYEEGSGFRPDR